MPKTYRTYRTKKKTYRKKRTKQPVFRRQRGLRLAIHPFKRQEPHQIVDLDAVVPATGWDTTYASTGLIGRLFSFKMSDFNASSDFTNLFKYYKLNSVNLKIYQATGATAATRNNSQCIITTMPQRDGVDTMLSIGEIECRPARKDRLLLNNTGKPHNIYMKLKQLRMTYAAAHGVPPSSTNYALSTPRWISTDEPDCEHYGFWIFIRSVNGSAFDNIQLRIEPTIYLSTMGTK